MKSLLRRSPIGKSKNKSEHNFNLTNKNDKWLTEVENNLIEGTIEKDIIINKLDSLIRSNKSDLNYLLLLGIIYERFSMYEECIRIQSKVLSKSNINTLLSLNLPFQIKGTTHLFTNDTTFGDEMMNFTTSCTSNNNNNNNTNTSSSLSSSTIMSTTTTVTSESSVATLQFVHILYRALLSRGRSKSKLYLREMNTIKAEAVTLDHSSRRSKVDRKPSDTICPLSDFASALILAHPSIESKLMVHRDRALFLCELGEYHEGYEDFTAFYNCVDDLQAEYRARSSSPATSTNSSNNSVSLSPIASPSASPSLTATRAGFGAIAVTSSPKISALFPGLLLSRSSSPHAFDASSPGGGSGEQLKQEPPSPLPSPLTSPILGGSRRRFVGGPSAESDSSGEVSFFNTPFSSPISYYSFHSKRSGMRITPINDPQVAYKIAHCLYKLPNYEQSISHITSALRVASNRPFFGQMALIRAHCYMRLSQYTAAHSDLDKAEAYGVAKDAIAFSRKELVGLERMANNSVTPLSCPPSSAPVVSPMILSSPIRHTYAPTSIRSSHLYLSSEPTLEGLVGSLPPNTSIITSAHTGLRRSSNGDQEGELVKSKRDEETVSITSIASPSTISVTQLSSIQKTPPKLHRESLEVEFGDLSGIASIDHPRETNTPAAATTATATTATTATSKTMSHRASRTPTPNSMIYHHGRHSTSSSPLPPQQQQSLKRLSPGLLLNRISPLTPPTTGYKITKSQSLPPSVSPSPILITPQSNPSIADQDSPAPSAPSSPSSGNTMAGPPRPLSTPPHFSAHSSSKAYIHSHSRQSQQQQSQQQQHLQGYSPQQQRYQHVHPRAVPASILHPSASSPIPKVTKLNSPRSQKVQKGDESSTTGDEGGVHLNTSVLRPFVTTPTGSPAQSRMIVGRLGEASVAQYSPTGVDSVDAPSAGYDSPALGASKPNSRRGEIKPLAEIDQIGSPQAFAEPTPSLKAPKAQRKTRRSATVTEPPTSSPMFDISQIRRSNSNPLPYSSDLPSIGRKTKQKPNISILIPNSNDNVEVQGEVPIELDLLSRDTPKSANTNTSTASPTTTSSPTSAPSMLRPRLTTPTSPNSGSPDSPMANGSLIDEGTEEDDGADEPYPTSPSEAIRHRLRRGADAKIDDFVTALRAGGSFSMTFSDGVMVQAIDSTRSTSTMTSSRSNSYPLSSIPVPQYNSTSNSRGKLARTTSLPTLARTGRPSMTNTHQGMRQGDSSKTGSPSVTTSSPLPQALPKLSGISSFGHLSPVTITHMNNNESHNSGNHTIHIGQSNHRSSFSTSLEPIAPPPTLRRSISLNDLREYPAMSQKDTHNKENE